MQNIEQITVHNFITKYGITATFQQVKSNPNMEAKEMFHWLVEIKMEGRIFSTFFSTGFGWIETKHGNPVPYGITYSQNHGFLLNNVPVRALIYRIKTPSLADVLDCLASDASALDSSFDEWASDLGYDSDSIKAEATFQACRKNAKGLKSLLGSTAFNELVSNVERL